MTDIIYRSKSALLEFVADNCTNLSASNNITAGFFYGDGSNLTNLPGGGGGDPGGSATQVQYNNAGSFAGSANLTFDGSNLTVGGDLTVTGNDIKGSGGTAITMDGSNNVTIAGDLTVNGLNIKSSANNNLFFNTDRSMYFDIDEDNNQTDREFAWRSYNTTLMTLTEAADLEIAGDLTVAGNDIKDSGGTAAITFDGSQNVGIGASPSAGLKLDVKGALRTTDFMEISGNLGLKDDLIFGASLGINNIIDSLGATRIYIDSGAHMSLVSRLGTANLVIQDSYTDIPTYLSVGGNIEMGGNLVAEADATTLLELNSTKIEFIHAGKERIEMDGNGIGMLGATPIADGVAITGDLEPSGDVTVGGDLTVTGNDIKGSGGTAITMDVSNNVTVAGELTSDSAEIITSNTGLTHDRALLVQNTADHCNIMVDAAANKDTNLVLSENGTVKWAIGNSAGSSDQLLIRPESFGDAVAQLSQAGNLQIDGDLTVSGNDIKDASGLPAVTFDGSRNTSLLGNVTIGANGSMADLQIGHSGEIGRILDSGGSNRIYFTDTGDMYLYGEDTSVAMRIRSDACVAEDNFEIKGALEVTGAATFNDSITARGTGTPGATNTYLYLGTNAHLKDDADTTRLSWSGTNLFFRDQAGTITAYTRTSDTTIVNPLFVNDYARIDALRVGTTSTDPGDGTLYVEGDLTVAGNDIKGSGGTAITMDVSNNVTVANDLTIAGGDIRNSGLMAISLSGQNVTLGNNLTVPGQITPGYDPQILAQNIFDPSMATTYTIVNDSANLYIVDWDGGDTSTTNPKVAFEAPAEGKVIVDVKCYIDDTSTSGAGPYVYAALSTTYGTWGTKIATNNPTIVGNGEKIIWYPDESDRGTRQFSFYVSGLTGGSTYTWYLYMRRWNDGDANRVVCGGSYPMFEMSVRPIYSSALIYTT